MEGYFSSLIGLAVLILVPIFLYNVVVAKKNLADSAFAGIDVFLKQRFDMIPNLVASVQAYMKHEQGLLQHLTELRTKGLNATADERDSIALDREVTQAFSGLRVAMEAYPELKANQNVLQLQTAIGEVEANIAGARRNYNATIMSFNNTIEMFPTNIMARIMKLSRRTLFEIPAEERQNVSVGQLFQQ